VGSRQSQTQRRIAAQPDNHINNTTKPGETSGPTHQATAAQPSQNPHHTPCEPLLTKEDLRLRLNLPNQQAVDKLVRRRLIPVVAFNAKTTRFVWSDVMKAIGRLTIQPLNS